MKKLFKLAPFIVGTVVLIVVIVLKYVFKIEYSNIRGMENVFESIVNFLSIVIGFYSAFYGMIISMQKTKFMKELSKSKYRKELPNLLLFSLISAFFSLIITILMQIFINYNNSYIEYIYYVWSFLVGVFITYAFQTSLLSIAMIFGSEPQKLTKEKMK